MVDSVLNCANFVVVRKIQFYRLENGVIPVEAFLDTLSDRVVHKILAVLKLIESQDMVSSKFFKKLVGTDLWECRIQFDSNIYRFIGFFEKNRIVILTHGFHKKTQKTPRAELERATKYMNDYMRRNRDV